MKKTMILLLGALMALALPGNGLKAQNSLISLSVKTLDRAALTSATVYAAPSATQYYYIDAAHVSSTWTSTASDLSTLTTSSALITALQADGSYIVEGNLSQADYATAFIVIQDVNNVYYVYGVASPTERTDGVFKACDLFTAVEADNMVNTAHIVYGGTSATAVCRDNAGFYYTTLTKAVNAVTAGATIYVESDITSRTAPDSNTHVTKPVTIDLGNHTVTTSLYIDNNADSVIVKNGRVTNITGNTTATGAIRLEGLIVNSLFPLKHKVVVDNCSITTILGATDTTLFIRSGFFGSNAVEPFLVNRRVLVPSTSGEYPFTVVEGYLVTYVNYNAKGDSLFVVVNTPDNRIVPAPSTPTFLTSDTVFGHYWTDPAFTNYWDFLTDVLTSDTILYAKWGFYDPATTYRLRVNHAKQNVTRDGYFLADSIDYVMSTVGDDTILRALPQYTNNGFHCSSMTRPHSRQLAGTEATVLFRYNRDTVVLVWNTNGGQLQDPTFQTTQVRAFEEVIAAMPEISKTGHYFTGWTYATDFASRGIAINQPVAIPFNVPFGIDTIKFNANFDPRPASDYPVTWTLNGEIKSDEMELTYNGLDRSSEIAATFVDDDNVTQSLTVTYFYNNNPDTPKDAGLYSAVASYSDTNYRMSNVLMPVRIKRFPTRPTFVWVDSVKIFDGNRGVENWNDSADLLKPETAPNDDVYGIVTSVLYFDATVGTGKTILAYLLPDTLTGTHAHNYELIDTFYVVTTEGGVIAPKDTFDFGRMNQDIIDGLYIGVNGVCPGDNRGIDCYLLAGNHANQYKLIFDSAALANGFQNVEWESFNNQPIQIAVPEDAPRGNYTVAVTLRNSDYVQYEAFEGEFNSDTVEVVFGVKLNKQYTRPLFEDVIAIVDTTDAIDLSTIQWYRNGQPIEGATYPYYQEQGGFVEGDTYYASFRFNGEDVTVYTCPQDSLGTNNYVTDNAEATVVSIYPNPTVDNVTIKVDNATQFTHTLRVMNIMGVTVIDGTFNGDSTTIDFSRFGNGSYTVSVDGIVVRVIKK